MPSVGPSKISDKLDDEVIAMDPSQIVDLDRYPIDQPDAPACQALVASCRRDIETQALCMLPDFLRPDALEVLQGESQALAPKACRMDNLRTPYGWMRNAGFKPDHPRSQLFRNRSGLVLGGEFPRDSAIKALYFWDPLTEFLRQVIGVDTLYNTACPHLSFNIGVEGEGDQFGWHFDTNDGCAVSLLVQQADEGGHFEFTPFIRSDEDENYTEIGRVFAGKSELVRQPAMAPGTFTLFRGHRSLHRVTPVGNTTRARLIVLFGYDQNPGMVYPESTVNDFRNPSSDPYYGRPS